MKTIQVFGVSNDEIESYIERKEVDSRFAEGLQRNKHIIVFGASKQGKTALVNKHIKNEDVLRVNCVPQTAPIDIYKSILRQLNFEFKEARSEKALIGGSVKVGFVATVKIPFVAGAKVSAEPSANGGKEFENQYKTVEYNLNLPQDIIEILKSVKFNKRIIVENFHYLTEDVQQEIAFHLRVFEDANILFIILGIWREKNRLAQYNGDLQDRLIEIPVEPWEKDDLRKVADKGSKLLKVSMDPILKSILENTFDSIGVFQELCKECCLAAKIDDRKPVKKITLTKEHLNTAIQKKISDYSGRHIRSIEAFVDQKAKTSDAVPLYLAYYFIKVLLNMDFENLEVGIKRKYIHDKIKEIHHRPDGVSPGAMTNFLHNIISSQINKNITPPLFDYDRSTRTVKIIDSTLYFFLRNTDKDEILSEIDSPV